MFQYDVLFVQRYTHAQVTQYTTEYPTVTFHVRGQRSHNRPGLKQKQATPYLSLTPGNTPIAFEYGSDRENWVIGLHTDGLQAADRDPDVAVFDGEDWAVLPAVTPVPAEHVDGWIGEFELMREATESPHAINRLRVKTGVADVMRYIIDQQPPTHIGTPAAELMHLICQDETYQQSLEEMSLRCGTRR